MNALSGTSQLDTNAPAASAERSTKDQRDKFSAATRDYFGLLSSIDTKLRKEIYALEEAEIVPAEAAARNVTSRQTRSAELNASTGGGAPSKTADKPRNTGATLRNLDVGWLNSQSDSMKDKMEADLWKAAQSHLIQYEKERVNAT